MPTNARIRLESMRLSRDGILVAGSLFGAHFGSGIFDAVRRAAMKSGRKFSEIENQVASAGSSGRFQGGGLLLGDLSEACDVSRKAYMIFSFRKDPGNPPGPPAHSFAFTTMRSSMFHSLKILKRFGRQRIFRRCRSGL